MTLRLHPAMARLVYCQDGLRRGSYEHTSFTFWGSRCSSAKCETRTAASDGRSCPAASRDALKRLGEEVRSWRLHRRVNLIAEELAQRINLIVAGWMQY
ncbi:group II intron maturase-specific domain-containing protein [Streptomyces antimycoticus]|uniref:group II intron maturase-specific domain-containing protein n=1 Tax=Streptomyces TaxID=1883 RepID=UPI003422FD01